MDPLTDTFRRMSVTLEQNSKVLKSSIEAIKDLAATGDPTQSQTEINRRDTVTVEIKCTYLKIVDINTVSQQYQADIFLQAKWEEPEFANIPLKKCPRFDPKVYWDPKLIILNNEELCLDRKSYVIRHDDAYEYPVVQLLWRFKGKFRENMELEHFPFDVQNMTLQVASERPYGTLSLIEDQHVLSTVNIHTFLDAQEWNIYKHVESFRDKTTMEFASLSIHPILYIQARVKRKVGYFMWNIVVIMLLITVLTFTAMAMEPSSGDRIGVSITLFLTAVAFKLVVKESLPAISYLTYLDVYILSLLIFLSIQSAENACMCALGRVLAIKELRSWDIWSQGSLAFILLLFHVLFAVHVQYTALRKRRIMEEKDKLYEKRKDYMDKFGRMMTNPNFKLSTSTHREKLKKHP